MNQSPSVLQERVLPTLNKDGTRRRIRPKLYRGSVYTKRFFVGWALILMFVGLPFVRIGGAPAVLLDLTAREFTFFGRTFFATDGVLLMLLMLCIFIGIIALTALVGRGWCGFGCPQTVYMELLFRPVERFFEGDRNSQLRLDKAGGGARRVLKNLVFVLLSVLVANVFLAYFVGAETLGQWMQSSPLEQPAGFLVMGGTAALVLFDFAYFREQMCTVICPYARLQAALLDKDSLIIGYDEKRGEPRHLGKPVPGAGDCIDCSACVVACPTGIDIREGLQLECIACGQCIDACNTIMPKVNKPLGLIRYASQRTLAGGISRVVRTRLVAYTIILIGLLIALIVVGSERRGVDITVLRGIGAPYVIQGSAVRNQVRVKLENRSAVDDEFRIEILFGEHMTTPDTESQIVIPENPLEVEAKARRTTSLFLVTPISAFQSGKQEITVRITGKDGKRHDTPYHLIGPAGAP